MELVHKIIEQYLVWILAGLVVMEVASLVVIVWLLIRTRGLNKRIRAFFRGKNGKDLEMVLSQNTENLKTLDQDIQELYNISNRLNSLAQKSIHRVGIIRFNPFKDIGGDQSFSVALLDGKNSGFTLSSLHTREGTRVYVKPINKGKSEKYTLTNEEIQAIKLASMPGAEKV